MNKRQLWRAELERRKGNFSIPEGRHPRSKVLVNFFFAFSVQQWHFFRLQTAKKMYFDSSDLNSEAERTCDSSHIFPSLCKMYLHVPLLNLHSLSRVLASPLLNFNNCNPDVWWFAGPHGNLLAPLTPSSSIFIPNPSPAQYMFIFTHPGQEHHFFAFQNHKKITSALREKKIVHIDISMTFGSQKYPTVRICIIFFCVFKKDFQRILGDFFHHPSGGCKFLGAFFGFSLDRPGCLFYLGGYIWECFGRGARALPTRIGHPGEGSPCIDCCARECYHRHRVIKS